MNGLAEKKIDLAQREADLSAMLRALMAKGYTEEAIALAVEVSQSTISKILSGKIRSPKFHVALRIQGTFQQYCE